MKAVFALALFLSVSAAFAGADQAQDVLVDHQGKSNVRRLLSGQNAIDISGDAAEKLFNDLSFSGDSGIYDESTDEREKLTEQRVGENITCMKFSTFKSNGKLKKNRFKCEMMIDPASGKAELGAVG